MFLNYKSDSRCKHDDKCRFRHVEPSKQSKKSGAKGSVALLTESTQLGCASQDCHPKQSIPRKEEHWDQITPSNSPRARGTIQKLGKEMVHREDLSQSVNLTSVVRALPDLRKGHKMKPRTKKDSPAEWAWDLAKSVRKRTNTEKSNVFTSLWKPGQRPVPTSTSPKEREFVVDSGAPKHMLSKKDLVSDAMESLRRSRNASTVVTASRQGRTDEEAQVYVHDLDLFVTVQILDDTPAVFIARETPRRA